MHPPANEQEELNIIVFTINWWYIVSMAVFPGESDKRQKEPSALDLILAKLATSLSLDTQFNRKTAEMIDSQIEKKEKELQARASDQNRT